MLTERDKFNIRLQFAGGKSKRKLAEEYGVSRSTILYTVDDAARTENIKRSIAARKRRKHGNK